MDDQRFQALMGLVKPKDMTSQQALANQLRGQHDIGQFLSLSPTVGDFGRSMQQSALDTAATAGQRRQQGLTRARQAERDRIADQRYQDELARSQQGYSDTQFVKQDGQTFQIGTNNRTGEVEIIPGTEGMTPFKTSGYSSSRPKMINVPGMPDVKIGVYDDGRVLAPNGEIYQDRSAFEADYPDIAQTGIDYAAQRERAETTAKEDAEATVLNLSNMAELDSTYATNIAALDQVVAATEVPGVRAGPIYSQLPTLFNPSALLDSSLSKLTLDALGKYKLTPVSDRDLEELRSAAAPNLTAPQLRLWAMHKRESLRRIREANLVLEDWIAENNRIPRGSERKQLQERMDQIKYGDGFDFAFKLGDAPTTDTEAATVTGTNPLANRGVTDEEWNSLSPEQQQMLQGGGSSPLSRSLNAQGGGPAGVR